MGLMPQLVEEEDKIGSHRVLSMKIGIAGCVVWAARPCREGCRTVDGVPNKTQLSTELVEVFMN